MDKDNWMLAPLWKGAVALILAFSSINASAVIINVSGVDLEWRQVTDTTSISWNQMDAVCANDGLTECTGSVGGVSVEGWIWATVSQVGALFTVLTPHPGGLALYNEVDSAWAPDFLAQFSPTRVTGLFHELLGMTSSTWTDSDTFGATGVVVDVLPAQTIDAVTTNNAFEKGFPSPQAGHWMFREVSIPEPASAALLALGLLGFKCRKY